MRDVKERILSGRDSWLEQFAQNLPGVKDYMEREGRRDADKMVRDHLASRLSASSQKLLRAQTDLTNKMQWDLLDDIERVKQRLETLMDRLRHADRGYAGFFDAIKVNEAELEQVYQHDMALEAGVRDLEAAVDAVSAAVGSGGDVPAALNAVNEQLDAWDAALKARESILSGIA
jgi:chromosome segregation ATPase